MLQSPHAHNYNTNMTLYRFRPGAIREARHRRHLTQADLAELAGCSPNSVYRAERSGCGDGMAKRFADALQVDVESFFIREESLSARLTPDQKEILLGLEGLTPAAMRVVRCLLLGLRATPDFCTPIREDGSAREP